MVPIMDAAITSVFSLINIELKLIYIYLEFNIEFLSPYYRIFQHYKNRNSHRALTFIL